MDRIDVLQVGRFWRIFINGGLVTREDRRKLRPREFLTDLKAWQYLGDVQRTHYARTGEHLGWHIKGEQ